MGLVEWFPSQQQYLAILPAMKIFVFSILFSLTFTLRVQKDENVCDNLHQLKLTVKNSGPWELDLDFISGAVDTVAAALDFITGDNKRVEQQRLTEIKNTLRKNGQQLLDKVHDKINTVLSDFNWEDCDKILSDIGNHTPQRKFTDLKEELSAMLEFIGRSIRNKKKEIIEFLIVILCIIVVLLGLKGLLSSYRCCLRHRFTVETRAESHTQCNEYIVYRHDIV